MEDFNPENHIKLAADDITKLRKSDVFRLFEECGSGNRNELARYIANRRDDLIIEVTSSLAELED
jgi:hypothetical protein